MLGSAAAVQYVVLCRRHRGTPHTPAALPCSVWRGCAVCCGRARQDGCPAVPGVSSRHHVWHRHDAVATCVECARLRACCACAEGGRLATQWAPSSAACATSRRCVPRVCARAIYNARLVCALVTTCGSCAAPSAGPALRISQLGPRHWLRRVCGRQQRRGARASLGRRDGDVCARLRHVWCGPASTTRAASALRATATCVRAPA